MNIATRARTSARVRLTWMLLLFLWGGLVARALPYISEFMADNGSTLADQKGEFNDWIEIANPDAVPVDLEGWILTDDPTRVRRWVFPKYTLAPGARVVVFASGNNLTQAGQPFHTDFRLSADGEYLALLLPGGSQVATEFAPRFPKQFRDVSFGLPPAGSVQDLLQGASLSFKVPASAEDLTADWMQWNPVLGQGWSSGTGLGAGYDTTLGGGDGGNLALKGTTTQSTTLFPASAAIDGDESTFTHTDGNDNASTWTLDLGREYDVARVVLQNRRGCCESRLRDITVQLLAADRSTVRFATELLNPENVLDGPVSLTVDLFDRNIGTVTARFVRVSRTPDPDLSGSNGQGNADEDNVLSLSEVEVYGVKSITYADLIRTDLNGPMKGRNSTVAVRIPFVVDEAGSGRTLALKMRYDDGFVAWMNGTLVAETNAPAVLNGSAAATAAHPDEQALLFETWPVPAALLQKGTNVLAIQGLNIAASDEDFLVDARLEAETTPDQVGVYFEKATPGKAEDTAWFLGRIEDPKFSSKRGFYSAAFFLGMTLSDPLASIRYTLDGSEPTEAGGKLYTGPIEVASTTVVRARAFRPKFRPSEVVSHTFIFPSAVAKQSSAPAGFPARWSSVNGDYAMDPAITTAAAYSNRLEAALRSLPSVCFSTATDNLFGATRGIYANPENGGITWERPVSMEWINPDGTSEFQVDAGLRIQGGYFRNRNVTRKHSLRVVFKSDYGTTRLREDLFGDFGAAREFDTLVFRAGANDGYAWDAARNTEQFIRDEFGRRLFRAMGQTSGHGRFVHIYLNGLYWGMYNLCERPNEDFSSTYFGGDPADWDSINAGDVKSGDLNAWNQLTQAVRQPMSFSAFQRLQGLDDTGARLPGVPVLIDMENYLDYMLLNIWGGNWDWPNKNFWIGRDRTTNSTGFKFYMWDFENTMGNNRDRSPLNAVAPRSDIASSWVGEPHFRLKTFGEYRLRFADHVQRHLTGNGALTPTALVNRYRQLAEEVETAVIAESARWGDEHFKPPQTLVHWRAERDWLLNSYLPQRTAVVLNQFKSAGLFPALLAPVAEPAGGSVSTNAFITLKTPARWIYYTLNGEDPRLPGGTPNPAAQRAEFSGDGGDPTVNPEIVPMNATWKYLDTGVAPGAGWTAADFNDASWLSGPAELGYGDGDEATTVNSVDTDPNTAGVQRNAATYFRTEVTVADPKAFESLNLEVRYDDAVAVYINGVEVHRSDNLPADAAHTTYATADRSDNSLDTRSALPVSLLKPGRNVIAAEVHQRSESSSDISFALHLFGVAKPSVPQGAWNAVPAFQLSGATTLRARSFNGTEWSPLMEARYTIDTAAPDVSNLVVSEIAYRPPDATTPSEKAVSTDRDDFEFIELMNIGGQRLNLAGLSIVGGIQFQFGPDTILGAGSRCVLVKNKAAFEARYGTQLPVAGEFAGRLGNSGDVLRLISAQGTVLRILTYGASVPWPETVPDAAFSLTLVRPETNPDPATATSWRASVAPGGSPGGSDALVFAGDPTGDANGNGRADIIDYALGKAGGIEASVLSTGGTELRLQVRVRRAAGADGALVRVETAAGLEGPWESGAARLERIQSVILDAGILEETYQTRESIAAADRSFVRVRVALPGQ